jgi:hypothetical protein
MAKKIEINMSDAAFIVLKNAYAKDDDSVESSDVNEVYIKNRLINILKSKVRSYDESESTVSYSSFSPS